MLKLCLFLAALVLTSAGASGQDGAMNNDKRNQLDAMLQQVSSDVVKHYYDPKLHGVDWDAKVRETREKVRQEQSINMAMAHVAALLDSLNDSHTYLIPPGRPYVLEHGWSVKMIGDKCYVTRIKPEGSAEAAGVHLGDQLLAINGYRVNRDNLWRIEYAFNVLRPQQQLMLTLQNPAGEIRKVQMTARFRPRASVRNWDANTYQNLMMEAEDWYRDQRIRTAQFGEDLLIAKLRSFLIAPSEMANFIGSSRRYKALILDLRENPGGAVETDDALIAGLFDHDVKIADRVGRNSTKPEIVKTNHHPFEGKLFVLVDSKSASASEILARVVQLEKRGVILGDRSSGMVMEARGYSYASGIDLITFYAAAITDANLIMTDGHSLEHEGVTPDQIALPNADDIAQGRDPVLSRAAEMAGVKLSPEDAAKLFPFQWPKERTTN